jgi:hypothetical protein
MSSRSGGKKRRRPLVLIIDDLHRDPGTSSMLFEVVADNLDDVRLMLAAAYRDESGQ